MRARVFSRLSARVQVHGALATMTGEAMGARLVRPAAAATQPKQLDDSRANLFIIINIYYYYYYYYYYYCCCYYRGNPA
jgi:hypothetical protein